MTAMMLSCVFEAAAWVVLMLLLVPYFLLFLANCNFELLRHTSFRCITHSIAHFVFFMENTMPAGRGRGRGGGIAVLPEVVIEFFADV